MHSRLRFGFQAPRATAAGLVAASLAWGLTAAVRNTQPENGGCCPQSSDGWVLFEDSNPRVPDFWRREFVVVDVIDVCPHGINFYFMSEEDGQVRYVALIIVKPSRELYETRAIQRPGDPPLETRLERGLQKYADLVAALNELFGVEFSPGGRMEFTKLSPVDRPLISPCRGLTLGWRGCEIKLRGYLDVYMTVFA